uniref:Uncharacterized protein n=1 Tax=Rhizophora mucronata TaxID=61149 RepID=A0A2P2NKG6_RHIMU
MMTIMMLFGEEVGFFPIRSINCRLC